MDTISRENNTSYLPIAGLLVGLVALALAFFALFKATSVGKKLDADSDQIAKIDTIESTANNAAQDAQKAKSEESSLFTSAQDGFTKIASDLNDIHASIAKLQEAAKPAPKPARASKAGSAAEGSAPGTVSADGTYTIKSGDSLAKIARANGVSLADLEAANPGADPKHLKVGQKINLPEKH
jgi:LysM repeat protein